MHTAQVTAQGFVHTKGRLQFRNDVVEAPRLGAVRRTLRVAVHRVTDPENRRAGLTHSTNQVWQLVFDRLRAETVNETDTSRFIIRVQHTNQLLQPFCSHAGADLDAYRICEAAEKFDVRAINRGCPHADPRKMRTQVVPSFAMFEEPGLGLLV